MKSLEKLLRKSRKNLWEKLLKSNHENPSSNISDGTFDTFWKDLRKESSKKLWKPIGKTLGKNPGGNSEKTPRKSPAEILGGTLVQIPGTTIRNIRRNAGIECSEKPLNKFKEELLKRRKNSLKKTTGRNSRKNLGKNFGTKF